MTTKKGRYSKPARGRGSKPGERRGGRRKGTPNKVTREFRETVRLVLEANADNVGKWLTQVAEGGRGRKADPARALDLLTRLAEFAAPKLSRSEVTGEGGGPVQTQDVSRVTDIEAARRLCYVLESALRAREAQEGAAA